MAATTRSLPGDTVSLRARLVLGALFLLLLAAPALIYPIALMKVLCFALFACAFNLVLGYTGLLSFGHAAFFGWAAYVAGHVVKAWGMPPEVAILAGTAAGAGLGLVFGWLAIRRQGIYFAMVTLALAQMMFFVALEVPFTHGEDGIRPCRAAGSSGSSISRTPTPCITRCWRSS
jgi:branched-chain amino acid transport system permease protein